MTLATTFTITYTTPTRPASRPHAPRRGFTLIELLVVISIIALLIGILLPSLGSARASARSTASLSNLRQLGLGIVLYTNNHRGLFPVHSSPSSVSPRTRWADYIFPYIGTPDVFLSPNLELHELHPSFQKPFAHSTNVYYGGYGYNFQYLGNSRTPDGVAPFQASIEGGIQVTSQTVTIADTAGSRKGNSQADPGSDGAAVYVIDPPLGSIEMGSRGSRRSSSQPGPGQAYYEGGNDEPTGDPDTYLHRAFPKPRNNGSVAAAFADGHGKLMRLEELDDSNGDGIKDNGYWNGHGDPVKR
jgi:prepilin-type N-terminal cleavage/methylation domain-containing protein